jgi:hypothetical protein
MRARYLDGHKIDDIVPDVVRIGDVTIMLGNVKRFSPSQGLFPLFTADDYTP